jgi:predicted DNA-binding transcriptional regulator AlpA
MSRKSNEKQGFGPEFGLNFKSNVNLPIGVNKKMEIEILKKDQVLKILSISECTLTALVKRKEIPHFYIGEKSLRFKKESILNWLNNLEKQYTGVAS